MEEEDKKLNNSKLILILLVVVCLVSYMLMNKKDDNKDLETNDDVENTTITSDESLDGDAPSVGAPYYLPDIPTNKTTEYKDSARSSDNTRNYGSTEKYESNESSTERSKDLYIQMDQMIFENVSLQEIDLTDLDIDIITTK